MQQLKPAMHLKSVIARAELIENGWTGEVAAAAIAQIAHPFAEEAWKAMARIYPSVHPTELRPCAWLSALNNGTVLLKLENTQVTGSFKARGATNKVLTLNNSDLQQGVVTCSTGNHALAFVHACNSLQKQLRVTPLVYLPETATSTKLKKLRDQGAELVLYGSDAVEAEAQARRVAAERLLVYVSPYNDFQVAGGQGSIAIELLQQLPKGRLDAVFVPVGGGGLISGIAAVIKTHAPKVRIIGCQPMASAVMIHSVSAGRILDLPSSETLSDGTAGGVEPGSITFEACTALVDEWVTVSEKDIAAAMVNCESQEGLQVEGSVGVAVASFIKLQQQLQGKNCVIVCCGGNVSEDTLARARQVAGAGVQ